MTAIPSLMLALSSVSLATVRYTRALKGMWSGPCVTCVYAFDLRRVGVEWACSWVISLPKKVAYVASLVSLQE